MRTVVLLAGLLFSLVAQPQEIYKWVDRNGVVHYSDQPGSPDAERIQQGNLSTYEPPTDYYQTQPESPPPGQPLRPAYGSLNLTSPQPDEVFFGAEAAVTASARLVGELQPGHTFVFYLDGQRVASGTSPGAQLGGLVRGTHFLRVAVNDADGNELLASPQVSFHVRMPSIQNPQNPLVRPPPNRPPGTQPQRPQNPPVTRSN